MMNSYRKGVGAVILNSNNLILVAKRLDSPNFWQMPQGGIETNSSGTIENTDVAVLREIEEEVGIAQNKLQILYKTELVRYSVPANVTPASWNGKYNGQEQYWYYLRFLGSDSDINLHTTHHPEFSDYKWSSVSDVVKQAISFKKDVYKTIFNYGINKKIISAE